MSNPAIPNTTERVDQEAALLWAAIDRLCTAIELGHDDIAADAQREAIIRLHNLRRRLERPIT